MAVSVLAGGSRAPMENSPPGTQTIPSGAGPGGPAELAIVGRKAVEAGTGGGPGAPRDAGSAVAPGRVLINMMAARPAAMKARTPQGHARRRDGVIRLIVRSRAGCYHAARDARRGRPSTQRSFFASGSVVGLTCRLSIHSRAKSRWWRQLIIAVTAIAARPPAVASNMSF